MKTNRAQHILLIVSVASVVCAVYWQSLFLPFIQDDWSILNLFKANEPLSILKQIFSYENKLFYRPLARAYLLIIYELFGPNPMPFHVIALTVHVINSCLVALIINIVTRDRLISYLAAIIYAAAIAIHLDPLAWAVGFYDVGGAFFFLISIWLFLSNKPIISAILYFFGYLFKESLILLPILLISYPVLTHLQSTLKKNFETILVNWKQTTPFLIAMIIVFTIQLSSGISPLDLPATNPYTIDLVGIHVIKNGLTYLVWMFQSFLPLLSVKVYTNQFFIFAVAVVLLYATLAAFRLRDGDSQSQQQILFLLMWLLVGLLPVLFLPNHTYRYYAIYALPAFVGLILFLIKKSFLFFDVKSNVIAVILISICSFAVFGSILQGNRIYSEGVNQHTLSDGTGLLIRRAAFVNIVYKGLKQYLPSVPSNSVIVIDNADLWSFDKDSGLQVWYNDNTIQVYALSDLKYDKGQPYIHNPIQSQAESFNGSINRNILLDPSRLFVFQVSNGQLNKIDLQKLK